MVKVVKVVTESKNEIEPYEEEDKETTNNIVTPGYKVVSTNPSWYNINRIGFQKWVANTLRYTRQQLLQSGVEDVCPLFPHQHVIKDYLQPSSPYRSLLLYQGLGTGKTRASLAVAEVLSTKYKIIVMLPASLAGNYNEEILQCANELYKRTGTWQFTKNTDKSYKKNEEIVNGLGVAAKVIHKNKGVWVCDKSTDSINHNYSRLSPSEQGQINEQIGSMIAKRYTFVKYNGLNMASSREVLKSTENFQNCVVIIDEVHNFISKVVNSSKIIGIIYEALLKCNNCKLLMLSGTPMINKPIEIAKICNLARGHLHYFKFIGMNGSIIKHSDAIQKYLNENKQIDFFDLDPINDIVNIIPLPMGFVWDGKKENNLIHEADESSQRIYKTHNALFKNIEHMLKKNGAVLQKKSAVKTSLLLPDDEEAFDELFIDYEQRKSGTPIKNPMLLARRLQGIVSYYESYDINQFPLLEPTETIKIQMPDNIFKYYLEVRQKEFALEVKKSQGSTKKSMAKQSMTSPNYYRSLSRAVCNFHFPDTIKRPKPGKIGFMEKEMSVEEDEQSYADAVLKSIDDQLSAPQKENSKSTKKTEKKHDTKKTYDIKIKKALKSLADGAFLNSDEILSTLSPKFMEVYNKVNHSEGTSMLYSQFRTVEGLGIFKLVLESRGFAKLDLIKDVNGQWVLNIAPQDINKPKYVEFAAATGKDTERNKLILHIFNSTFEFLPQSLQNDLEKNNIKTNINGEFIKLMMITQSGAEGISLKNVRNVHIMEPYWNNVRIKQVIGRAVRAGSHLALPPEKRNVKVFMYLMTFSKTQLQKDVIKTRENSMTSDEYIYDVAIRKSTITDSILKLVKSSSIDCMIYTNKHNDVTCTNIPRNFGKPKNVLYSYQSINDDPSDAVVEKQTKSSEKSRNVGILTNKKTNMTYKYLIDTGEILDQELLKRNIFRTIGLVVETNTKKSVTIFE
jgi:superfamily II DNA or RNA helicase